MTIVKVKRKSSDRLYSKNNLMKDINNDNEVGKTIEFPTFSSL